jgi:S-layer homology domain/Glucodextranase, domain B
MGKCYVGLDDDVSSIFLNPAGLANLKTWQAMSMSTKLLNEIDYLTFAGTYNTDYGTFGLGYVSANLSGSFVTSYQLVDGGGHVIIPVTTEEAISYSSTVLLLSYGSEAKRFLNYDFLDNVSVGASLKIFSQGLTGGGISDGLMTGYDMDLGMQYKMNSYLSFGWSQIDALPVSMGGKLTSPSGLTASLPTTTKLGMAFKVLGEDGAYYTYPQKVTYLLDMDYSPTISGYPTLFRTGVEWWMSDYLALRMGLDQDVIGSDSNSGYSVDTNLTAGVGVSYNGFQFDYAYHRYGAVTDNDTNYISFSYLSPLFVAPPPVTVEAKPDYLKVFTPVDKIITHDTAVDIKGKVSNLSEVSALLINGKVVKYADDGSFDVNYPLAQGKNIFIVSVVGNDQKELGTVKLRILKLISFKDVTTEYWAKEPIEYLATLGIIGGYPDGSFMPQKDITRAELTTLLVKTRVSGTPEAVNTQFKDVTRKHWASYFIKNGVDMKMVNGYPDGTFKPAKSLNRAEGVTIFSRFSELAEPPTMTEGPFPDVPGRHWAAKSIMAARSAGLLVYLNGKPFEPSKALSRSEAAEILSHTPFATAKIKEMKDFNSY